MWPQAPNTAQLRGEAVISSRRPPESCHIRRWYFAVSRQKCFGSSHHGVRRRRQIKPHISSRPRAAFSEMLSALRGNLRWRSIMASCYALKISARKASRPSIMYREINEYAAITAWLAAWMSPLYSRRPRHSIVAEARLMAARSPKISSARQSLRL